MATGLERLKEPPFQSPRQAHRQSQSRTGVQLTSAASDFHRRQTQASEACFWKGLSLRFRVNLQVLHAEGEAEQGVSPDA